MFLSSPWPWPSRDWVTAVTATALGMAQYHQNRGVYMGKSIFNGPSFIHIAYVSGHANDKKIHDPGINIVSTGTRESEQVITVA